MRAIAGGGRWLPAFSTAVVGCAIGFLALAATDSVSIRAVPAAAAVLVFAAFHRQLLVWRSLTAALVLVIIFIPMRRYTLPIQVSATFKLEPYRLFVAFLVVGWIAGLLADPRIRARASGLEKAFLLIAISMIGSIVMNLGSIQALGVSQEVVKSLVFFASFFFVFYIVMSVVKTHEQIDTLLRVLVGSGTIVAVLAIVESRTQYNVFDHLRVVMPFLQFDQAPSAAGDITGFTRGGEARVYASAEHPIALGALLVMLIPVAIYLAERQRRLWGTAAVILLIGALATVSRTGIVMLLTMVIVYAILRPRWVRRAWPAVILAPIVIHFALPHTLGILKSSILPSGGVKALVAEQQSSATSRSSSGRLADVLPTLDQVSRSNPVLGVGFGSRVVDGPLANARILDDQWLGTLLETGFVGFGAWLWLFVRFIRRTGRAAREETDRRGSLLVAITASVTSFATGMLLFDAFGFTQETFVMFLLLAVGCIALQPFARRADGTWA